MKKFFVNSFNFNNQKFLYKTNTKNLTAVYFDLEKEKKSFYFKHYKKFVKLKGKTSQKISSNLSTNFLSTKLNMLNVKLTKKDLTNVDFLNSYSLYKNLKQENIKVKNFKGYTKYYNTVFSIKS